MEIRNLGKSGLRVSAVGLGCNNFGWHIDVEQSRAVVHKAMDAGITLLDTADIYGDPHGASESALGQILGPRRADVVLATKFGATFDEEKGLKGGARRYIMTAVESSLKRLKTDWIDLYQLHRFDPLTPQEETLRALDDLVTQGKIRYYGCSNVPAWRVVEAQWTARDRGFAGYVSLQDEYSLLVREAESDLIPMAQEYGLGLLPYFPLASGLLTGKYSRDRKPADDTRFAKTARLADRYMTDENLGTVEKLKGFAEARGHTMVELAFSWLAAQPAVSSVIAGATRPEQVEQNARAADWKLSAEDLAEIDHLSGRSRD
ncbi:Predicted oxidoreductase [Faunimonas pinastri]|uniref:Predicted oxidoreductase n=1 Tax=Faunimonas pinastri TaxID=1855383 RepID=A0A1H9PWD9_9HYPH|nr:aldo/keto reductase [Faunimonas pinastri]SER52089.1 Predicted oxidoreductase [Faunimonas pinastri]